MNEDSFVDVNVLANDSDPEGDQLSVIGVGAPAHGTATINPNGTVRYTPAANYNGPDSFTYTVSDGTSTRTATVSITVSPVNDPPVAVDDAATTDEDVAFAIAVLGNDTDIDGIDILSVSSVGAPAHGTAALNPDGTIRYTPVANYFGTDSFTYTVSDGAGGTDTATVNITINSVNDAPFANADAALINENTVATISVLANDTDIENDILTVTAVGAPAHGATAINLDRTISYTPQTDWFGVDSFTYTIDDGNGGVTVGNVTVTVNNIPEARGERALTSEEQTVAIQVIANDVELDGDALFVSAAGNGAHGTVTIGTGGTVNYTPNLNFYGEDSFTYTVSDGRGGSDTASVIVTVEEVVDDGELMVNPTATANTRTHNEATIAALTGGGHVVVYQVYGDDDIYARRYGEGGLPIGEAFRVSTNTGGSIQQDATVAALADGGFVIVYTSTRFDNGNSAIVGRRYDADGVAMGGEFLVGPSNSTSRDSASVAALEDGGFVVAYEENQTLAVQRYNADGTSHGDRQIISTTYSYGQPAVAGLAGGGYVVTELGYFTAGGVGFKTVGYVFGANGALVVGPYSLTQTPGAQEEERLSAVAALPNGGFVAVWQTTYGAPNNRDVVARRFNADGSPAGDQFIVNTVTAGYQGFASVAALPDGRFIIDWTSFGQDGDNPANETNVYAQMYDPIGNRIGSPFRVNETSGGFQSTQGANGSGIPHNPTVAVLADGTIAFTWAGVGEGSPSGVFTRRFTADGMIVGTVDADSLTAGKGQDVVQGLEGDDTLSGMLGDDQLFGGAGNDLLLGGPGADSIDGGDGNDTASYIAAPIGVTVSLAVAGAQNTVGAGTDTLVSIENLTGSAWADILTGNGEANILTGGGDADLLAGGAGGDTFVYLSATDSTATTRDRIVAFELGVDKIDLAGTGATAVTWVEQTDGTGTYNIVTVHTPAGEMMIRIDGPVTQTDFILGTGASTGPTPGPDVLNGTPDADTIDGLAGNDVIHGLGNNDLLYGGADNDQLFGDDGDDLLDGGTGDDAMAGGTGNDIYFVDNALDRVSELAGQGRDVVYASVSYALGAGQEVEVLSTVSQVAGTAINLTGNGIFNEIYGNDGDNVIDGGGGSDYLRGYAGNDIYFIDHGSDLVVETAGGGRDVIYTSVNFTLGAGSEIEVLSASSSVLTDPLELTGNALFNELYGNAGANILDGGGGADYLRGYGGNDLYFVNHGSDLVIEGAGEGSRDVIYARTSYTLGAGVGVEVLSVFSQSGGTAIDLTGNELANELYGNTQANYLDGGAGADYLQGFGGNDSYVVDTQGDVVAEGAGEGSHDVVFARASYALGAGVEVEVLSTISGSATTAIDLTGNELANELYGNNGANVLNGGAGNDYLLGFGGADIFAFTTALGGGNVDQIGDFLSGTDKIALDDAVFTGLTAGALPAGAFVTGSQAADADDRIIYDSATGQLFYDADGAGGNAAVLFATLDGHPALAASDFMVI